MRRFVWKLVQACCVAVVLFVLLDCVFPVNTQVDYAPLIRSADGTVMHAFLTRDQQWRFETKLNELTPELRQAILFKEDKQFDHHFGINPFAVARAFVNNVFHLKRTSGASTITMQVARLLAPKKRTYGNKCLEMFRALQMECHYSKDEILALYLNLVPYGSNIQGVKAASLLYFNKSPDQLSLAELTALSIIPNRPNSLVIGRDNAYIIEQRNLWLNRFADAQLFSQPVIADALSEPLTAFRHAAPREAPQLAWRLRFMQPGKLDIQSTIDRSMQRKAESIVCNYTNALRLRNIHNAAVLVIDNRTHQARVYIGSPDFSDRAHNGQVDGVHALRSPGSTLKPFLYGIAFDAGLCTPQTVLEDVPVNIGGYSPENYDLQFRGKVSVENALRQSLNIPAVSMLQTLTVPAFLQHLHDAGFNSAWQQRKRVGMSMILGGVTVRLDELTNLYSAFANGGKIWPLQLVREDTNHDGELVREDTNQGDTSLGDKLVREDTNQGDTNQGGDTNLGGNTSATHSGRPVAERSRSAALRLRSGTEGTRSGNEELRPGTERSHSILSRSSDFMICKTLSELTRPDLPNTHEAARGIPRIAWKTGTSYGRKDAWSVGFNARYTIGVWLGNFDGRGVQDLSGAGTATPLLFELFNALDRYADDEWLQAPAELSARYVCRETGKLPADFCTDQVMDYFIPGISPNVRCDHQRDVWISADETFSYCTTCLPPNGYKMKSYPNISPALAAFYDQHHVSYERIPPHNPACGRVFDGQAPQISTLQNGMTYLIIDKGKQSLQLGCKTANDVQKVYWYLNDKFYASAKSDEKIFFMPEEGAIKISCTDDKGRNANVEIKVKGM